jgi:hypothetical protein
LLGSTATQRALGQAAVADLAALRARRRGRLSPVANGGML